MYDSIAVSLSNPIGVNSKPCTTETPSCIGYINRFFIFLKRLAHETSISELIVKEHMATVLYLCQTKIPYVCTLLILF